MRGYNVFETFLEFFLHINVMMAESTVDPIEQNTQELPEVNEIEEHTSELQSPA